MKRNRILASIVVIITVLSIVITAAHLPVFLRDQANLYTSYEYAQMYLDDDRYSELLIEYNYVVGYQPSYSARSTLVERIETYSEKREIREVMSDEIDIWGGGYSERGSYTREDIYSIVDEYTTYMRDDNTMVMNVFYLDGEWEEEPNVLGLTFGNHYVVMFRATIENAAQRSQDLDYEDVESAVLVHEFGHLISLVGIGYESAHEDESYPHHCDESAGPCVMAASVQIKEGEFTAPPPTDFCELCIADIEHIRSIEPGWGIAEYITSVIVVGEAMVGSVWFGIVLTPDKGKKKEYEVYREYYENDFKKKIY